MKMSDIFNRTGQDKLDFDGQMLKFGTAHKLLDLTGLKLIDRAKYLSKRFVSLKIFLISQKANTSQ